MSTPSRTFKIAAIPADGVGTRSSPPDAASSTPSPAPRTARSPSMGRFPWGCEYYSQTGRMMAEDGLDSLKDFDAIYFGAVGWPTVPDHVSLWGLRLAICQGFDQYANVRPVHLHPGVASPLRKADDTRPRLGRRPGEQRGRVRRPRRPQPGRPRTGQRGGHPDRALHREGLRADHPLRLRTGPHPRGKKVTSVTKSNAQQYGMVLWDEIFARVARTTRTSRPRVCSSTPWRRISCSSRRTLGGRRLQPLRRHPLRPRQRPRRQPRPRRQRQLNPERRFPSMFEPVHGSAPDIAGQGMANPIARSSPAR